MKPIKLILKGLNSFVEEQTIDFNKLADKGLFGIFGPTGSGKSTVLDGITLALYSKTARDSSDFINAKGETASIHFEFQIRENTVKHYIIDRSFKRNATGGMNARKPTRIMEIIEGEEILLEDAPTKVDKKCIEIIGLKFEDFIRTVVLPQGKFSEFLKLEGTPKRDMLERLFSLGQYGDELSRKLSQVTRQEKSHMDQLEGYLKAYEEVSEQTYAAKKELLISKQEEEKRHTQKLDQIQHAFTEGERLWNLQEELKKHHLKEKELNEQKQEIEAYKLQVEQGENALKVKPYIEAVLRTQKEMKQIQEKWEQDKKLFLQLEQQKNKVQKEFEEARTNKDQKVPELKIVEHAIKQALEEEASKVTLEEERARLLSQFIQLDKEKTKLEKALQKYAIEMTDLDEILSKTEKEIESLKVDPKEREKIQEGLLLQSQTHTMEQSKIALEKEAKESKNCIENLQQTVKRLEAQSKEKKASLAKHLQLLQKHMESCPGDATTLLEKQEKLNQLKINKQTGTKLEQSFEEISKRITQTEVIASKALTEKEEIDNRIKDLREKVEKIKQEKLAHLLREKLEVGMPCPVCGSKAHQHIEEVNEFSQALEVYEEQLEQEEVTKRALENKILIHETNVLKDKKQQKELADELALLGEWSKVDVEKQERQFEQDKQNSVLWHKQKEEQERAVQQLKEDIGEEEIHYSTAQSAATENQKNFDKYTREIEKVKQDYKVLYTELLSLEETLKIKDFIQKNKAIKSSDQKREALEQSLAKMRIERKEKEEKKEALKLRYDQGVDQLATIRTQGEAKKTQIEEKVVSIKKKVGERIDLKAYEKGVKQTVAQIEEAFTQLERTKKQVEASHATCEKEVETGNVQCSALQIRLKEEKENLESALERQGFEKEENVRACLKTEQQIKQFKESIKLYEMQVSQLQGKLQEVKEKIKGRELTSEDWELLKENKQRAAEELKVIRTLLAQMESEAKQLEKQLEELKEILKERKTLEHKLSLLKDLESLFKGKRFVEFVAMHQLKYISMEASKKLKEITSGTYGLELDESGKFIIRDYKNGGATRDASTLSGGETFLASLALALALSSQIQLKGTAPLELFFLDEGFGTLDDSLLDVVMNALEKLHHKRLSVGIISHVESIKNRVPVKLILTPAEAGIGGSKVTLDRS